MGILISTLIDRFFPSTPSRIIMLGLDNAGKTTVLYKLKLGEVVTTIRGRMVLVKPGTSRLPSALATPGTRMKTRPD